MRNVIEGYGDRYIIPTHSVLDDLAIEFGYDAAGQALKSAREQSRRMVEQGEAAACDYVEANRREIAIRFVIDAFNGRVDGILVAREARQLWNARTGNPRCVQPCESEWPSF